jgi:hypothetical protein
VVCEEVEAVCEEVEVVCEEVEVEYSVIEGAFVYLYSCNLILLKENNSPMHV